jgi:hypothetical protein
MIEETFKKNKMNCSAEKRQEQEERRGREEGRGRNEKVDKKKEDEDGRLRARQK